MRDYKALVNVLRNCVESANGLNIQAADAIDALIAALTASNEVIAKSKPKWISVNERLPDVNKRVLACASILGKPFVWDAVRWNGEEWETEKEAAYEYWTPIDFPVTHWMPLPEPPTTTE